MTGLPPRRWQLSSARQKRGPRLIGPRSRRPPRHRPPQQSRRRLRRGLLLRRRRPSSAPRRRRPRLTGPRPRRPRPRSALRMSWRQPRRPPPRSAPPRRRQLRRQPPRPLLPRSKWRARPRGGACCGSGDGGCEAAPIPARRHPALVERCSLGRPSRLRVGLFAPNSKQTACALAHRTPLALSSPHPVRTTGNRHPTLLLQPLRAAVCVRVNPCTCLGGGAAEQSGPLLFTLLPLVRAPCCPARSPLNQSGPGSI
ncbi:MAG: hypothetical protein J3K34DRAFT_434687 [Monoraphidium minutum]|nr:MAG: hypothetical protein J3K34DRAFT_434687 [Monoraphidium minutum]